MATVLDLVNSALHLIGAKDPIESATAQEAADGLASLNNLLDSWTTDRLFVFRLAETVYNWPATAATATVGIGGDINITRPVQVEDSYIVSSGISYPVQKMNRDGYTSIPQKNLSVNFPEWMYYDAAYPLATLYLYTVPASLLEFHLVYWAPLSAFGAITDVVSFPPGYQRALRYNLAVEIASEYSMDVPPAVAAIALKSAANIKRLNSPPVTSQIEVAFQPSRDIFSIYRGW
jgi:hypothetical protein